MEKGPCDGVGGCTKRMADVAVKSGQYVIQDAADFYKWGLSCTKVACVCLTVHVFQK